MLLLLAALGGSFTGELVTTVAATGAFPVELTYRLELEEAAEELPFTVLEARGAKVARLTVNGAVIDLDRSRAPQLTGVVDAPGSVLVFRYEVTGDAIPIVVPGVSPGEARPDTFNATLSIPEGMHLVESFPTGIVRDKERYRLELPIVPAFVAVALSPEASWWTYPRIVDGAAIVFFVGIASAWWWRRR